MDLRTSQHGCLGRLFFLFLLALAASALVSAQDIGGESGDNASSDTEIPLDRRTKMLLRPREYLSNQASLDSDETGLGLFDAFFASLSMIMVSEIGDETFIIAALMAMRHPKSIVLSGALAALVVMTVLSTGLGRIVPNLISRKHTNSAATGKTLSSLANLYSFDDIYQCMYSIFAFVGSQCLYSMLSLVYGCFTLLGDQIQSHHKKRKWKKYVEEKLEAGQGKTTFRRFFSRFCTPIFLESFILTFLAEWGDRSQIATIALATHKNAIGVAVGATLGHTICTSIAVVGGSMLAAKISQRTVATVGGLLFLGFSLSSYFYPPL
ncbi:hypothetical protein Taro_031134 [Colocasia esculenta]|uniref:GDT1 family protein n=1 Tax=Colocasia esculenta TaxID=4460 RepID=A0A843VVW3_COLES|nr:hypothetical protein [Colocasia esculenta]